MRLSECKTLEDLKHFVPCNPERLYFNNKGEAIPMDRINFHVSTGMDKFIASKKAEGYCFDELFTDEESYKEYAKENEIRDLKIKIYRLYEDLAENEKRLNELQGTKEENN